MLAVSAPKGCCGTSGVIRKNTAVQVSLLSPRSTTRAAGSSAGGACAAENWSRRANSGRRVARPRLPLPFRRPAEPPYRIAGIPWPGRTETCHTIISGTTGSGKTVLIADLVEQIRERGERCVLYDKMGSYAETFFDPRRDVLLNPLDARAPRWSPFLEARNARDFDTMAAALIPRQKDAVDPFWITAARQLFSHGAAVFWKRG